MTTINLKLAAKLFPKGRKIDTVKQQHSVGQFVQNHDVLLDAFNAWCNGDRWRRMAARNEMYTFGNQWGDRVPDPDSCSGSVTEEELIRRQGLQPLKNNRIRSITRSILGVFSGTQTEPVCVSRERDEQGKGEMMSATLQYVYQLNKLWELDRRNLEYMLLTGVPVFKSTFGWRNGKMDVWTDLVNYNHFFFDNAMNDPRHWDCRIVGEIHDIGMYDVISQFSGGDRKKADELRSIYAGCDRESVIVQAETLTKDAKRHVDFYVTTDENRAKCRVIEVWRKESKERLLVHDRLTGDFYKVELEEETDIVEENERRVAEQSGMGISPADMKLIEYEWFVDSFWQFYYLSPQGHVLGSDENPYWHESHPYSFKIYPFYNGRVYPFISDFIDQQRYINRLITMQDLIMKTSAKGVLMFPEDAKPDGMSMEDIADAWATYNGIIYYKPKPGMPAPQQIITNSSHTGAYDMLSLQLRLLEEISGVHGALQGQTPKSGTPASLYVQQTQNSATNLTDLFESFREVREERDMKNLKLIQQYYTDKRYININTNARANAITYDPQQVRNAEFDVSIVESMSTPAYRLVMNDFLMQLFSAGQVTLKELLQNGAFPFADKLLQSIESREREMQQVQQAAQMGGAGGIDPAMLQQMQAEGGIDPAMMEQMHAENIDPAMLEQLQAQGIDPAMMQNMDIPPEIQAQIEANVNPMINQ